jgi:hypothetical protein
MSAVPTRPRCTDADAQLAESKIAAVARWLPPAASPVDEPENKQKNHRPNGG